MSGMFKLSLFLPQALSLYVFLYMSVYICFWKEPVLDLRTSLSVLAWMSVQLRLVDSFHLALRPHAGLKNHHLLISVGIFFLSKKKASKFSLVKHSNQKESHSTCVNMRFIVHDQNRPLCLRPVCKY